MERNIFAVYKPKGLTSHDIVNEVRRITGVKKVGHAGTLDPLARGVLVVGVGREATKKLNEIVAKEKEYVAVIKLGEESETDDEEGEKKSLLLVDKFVSLEEISKVVKNFIGKIMQVPPIYSAIKIKGRPAHRRARRGENVKLMERKVEIKEIEILEYDWPFLKIRVITGPGVYIRALARDIGRKLAVGGYLYDLERKRVGEFKKEESFNLNDLKIYFH